MHPRHRLDIRVGDLAYGLGACLWAVDPERHSAAVLSRCGLQGLGLVTFSVRSAWDLLLTALAWPAGDEVLVSAITHPDMVMILQSHGLRVVPLDIDPDTLAPSLAELDRACTPRTRAIMVVHLFGGRLDLGPVADFARQRGLLLVEDAAQAFTGPASLGAGSGDVALYSFGMIKTASAGGGAILVVHQPALLAQLERLHQSWPVQDRRSYAARLLKVAGMLALAQPWVYGLFFRICARLRVDPDEVINASTRSFAPSEADDVGHRLAGLRRRPSPALAALLSRRLARFDDTRLSRRAAVGERVASALPETVRHPGDGLLSRTHWLFPVLAPDPEELVAALRRRGLDPSRATSNLGTVTSSDVHPPRRAAAIMESIVYLPVYPELPEAALADLLRVVVAHGRPAGDASGGGASGPTEGVWAGQAGRSRRA